VLSHRHVQLNRSLSHCVSQENHLEYHIISTLCTEETSTSFHLSQSQRERHTQLMGFLTPQGHTTFHLRLREEPHTHLMGFMGSPHTGAHNIPSPSQRGTTHPSHGHTQLMGFLTPHRGTQRSISVSERNHTPISWAHPTHGLLSGRLTQSVSWRMSHAAVIINIS
jgi:hypothetical protein